MRVGRNGFNRSGLTIPPRYRVVVRKYFAIPFRRMCSERQKALKNTFLDIIKYTAHPILARQETCMQTSSHQVEFNKRIQVSVVQLEML